MKFKPKQSFYVIESGLKGKIIAISFNSIYQQEEYVVEWNHESGIHQTYEINECDPIWEHDVACPVVDTYNVMVKNAVNSIPISTIINPEIMCNAYNHDWVDVGFHHSKIVCKVCDRVKADAH